LAISGQPKSLAANSVGVIRRKTAVQTKTETHARNGASREASNRSTAHRPQVAAADVPPLAAEDREALASFQKRQQVLRDLTLGCIAGNHTGAYIYGPPGVSKTFTICNTLREKRA
jgi:hypothetical protein